MRRCFCILISGLLLAAPPAAHAQGPALDRYASALRAFDPALEPDRARRLAAQTLREATAAGLDARLVVALVAVESGWKSDAVSPAGARGLGQLMPATAAGLGVDPADPEANLHATVVYVRALLDRYAGLPPQPRLECALAAYNAGAGAVSRYGGIPPFAETRAYVRAVIALWRRLAGA
ncbi:MAG: lytic transglycosylase domain-containing protein [Candidatus Velthaea sp.]